MLSRVRSWLQKQAPELVLDTAIFMCLVSLLLTVLMFFTLVNQ